MHICNLLGVIVLANVFNCTVNLSNCSCTSKSSFSTAYCIGNSLNGKKDQEDLSAVVNELVDLVWHEIIRILLRHLHLKLFQTSNYTE